MELNELQQQRLAKLERLREAGIDPYPPRSTRTHRISEVLETFDERAAAEARVTLVGRIVGARRVMGKLAFAHIEDESGSIQLWVSKADLGDTWFERFRDDLDTFDIVRPLARCAGRAPASRRCLSRSWGCSPRRSTRRPRSGTGCRTPRSATASATST
jgi:lysyl-tRNA synthetase class II